MLLGEGPGVYLGEHQFLEEIMGSPRATILEAADRAEKVSRILRGASDQEEINECIDTLELTITELSSL